MTIPKNRKKTNVRAPLKSLKPEIAPIGMNGQLNTMYSNTENPNKSLKSIYSPDKHDFSEISSGWTNKMGEGKNGPFHCPLPKVVVRSEEKSLKSHATTKHRGKPPQIEIVSQESRQVLEEIIYILSKPSLFLT